MSVILQKLYKCSEYIGIFGASSALLIICFHIVLSDYINISGLAFCAFFGLTVAALVYFMNKLPSAYEILLILIITCTVCFLAFKIVNIELYGDIKGYYMRALNYAAGELYGRYYTGIFPHIIRYPWFMSFFIRLFGDRPMIFFAVNLFALF